MLYQNTDCINQYNDKGTTPSYIYDHLGNKAWRLKWVNTDGWRGYYEAVPVKKYGWIKIDDGWTTGEWDDAGDNAYSKTETRLKKLAKEYASKGYDVTAVYVLTSNVFSTAFDLFIKQK